MYIPVFVNTDDEDGVVCVEFSMFGVRVALKHFSKSISIFCV
tara:strand:- start:2104 stop:2229 length:126 start_codon:yes stop_codon:yes gene_type:complete